MRNHSARVVLGACLFAASVAAQAPATSFRTASGNEGRIAPDDFGLRPIGERLQNPQDPVDYSLVGQFRTAHGEFMDRRERYVPDIDLRTRILPNQRINGEPGSFDMIGYDLDARARAVIATEAYLTVGAYYLGRRYNTSNGFGTAGNGAGNGIGDETLVGAGLHLGFGVFLDDNWLLELETSPGAWSDLDDGLHREDFDFPSQGLLTIRALDNFFFKIGARYNQVYEDAPWLPVLGFGWEVVDGFRLDILAPERLELSFWPSNGFGILFGAGVTGAEYHVHTAESIGQRANLRVQEVVSYLGFVSQLNDHASFGGRLGIVVAGDYDLTSGRTTPAFNRAEGALDQGFFAEFSFGISF
ncbi:MAG: DUF6268 family outer membrane beta-barrel protein [Planctomycetota bacterium]